MLQTMDVDFVARAPRGSEVEELTQKALVKCLRNKIPINQFLEMSGFESTGASRAPMDDRGEAMPQPSGRGPGRDDRPPRRDDRSERSPTPMPREVPVRAAPLPVPPAPMAPPEVTLPPELQHYFDLLAGMENTSKCVFVGPDDAVLAEVAVKEMIDALAALAQPAKAIVFDGIVSQRLLDVAQEKGIGIVVANRLGAIGKIPETIRVVTRSDLQSPSAPR